jgi:hypothetical protein
MADINWISKDLDLEIDQHKPVLDGDSGNGNVDKELLSLAVAEIFVVGRDFDNRYQVLQCLTKCAHNIGDLTFMCAPEQHLFVIVLVRVQEVMQRQQHHKQNIPDELNNCFHDASSFKVTMSSKVTMIPDNIKSKED